MVEREKWLNDMSEWFRDVIDRAEIYDYRYPIKGCGVWRAQGFKLRQNILTVIRTLHDKRGHDEMLFPLLIPEDLLEKESVHIKGFEDEVYWVTHGGKDALDVKLALRPTSETIITPLVKLWVRSHADLPKKIYQIGSIFRYETKATRPMIRVREVTTFKEAHTYHATHDEALKQVQTACQIYKEIFDSLALPYFLSERPEWDKFAGALTTYAFDTLFPDGRTLQIGTTHDLGQNFSKSFNFTFETINGDREFVWQTSYGISERLISAVITVHGDDRGLVLPPIVAPIQIVIIPILYKGYGARVNDECAKLKTKLEEIGLRVKMDDRDNLTPGAKFYEYELKGVPIRVEVGPRDIEANQVTLVRRDTLKRTECKRNNVVELVQRMCDEVQKALSDRACKWFNEHTFRTESIDEAKEFIGSDSGIVEMPWCGDKSCGVTIEETTDARILGIPLEEHQIYGKCPICGSNANEIIRIAKAY